MSVEKRSADFKNWIAEADVFDIDIWWAPTFDQGFVCYDNWETQLRDYGALGLRRGIVTTYTSAFFDPYIGNEEVVELIKGRNGLYGCMVAVPEMGYTEDQGEAYVRSLMVQGVVAARLFPKTYIHSMEEYAVGPILRTLERLGLPVMLWHTEASWDVMDRICTNYPNLNVIVESHERKLLYHARDYVGLMRKHKNFFVETHNLVLFNEFETIYQYCGCDQLLYGSYFPYTTPHFSLYPVMQAVIPDKERRNIISGNAERIFHL